MTEQPEAAVGNIPKWDTADRMRKSMRTANVTSGEMADYLQVGANTVSTWINGRVEATPQTLRLWALRTGVPFTWLCHNDLNPCDLRPRGERPRLRRSEGQGGRNNYPSNSMHYSRTSIAS